ncbi:MAG: DUF2288 domain-containing protein [Gammaproteobacteria bacterium]|nr:DUF2288 domain-containing protein [Gammaproteobacteria bacterium]MBU1447923.1 DUF2288 domain-containing protein [Gammaproteobacteria bacterium]
MDDSEKLLRGQINLETAQIAWRELQRFFASGATIFVGPELDLVEVAYQIAQDNAAQVAEWMEHAQITRVTDEQALAWHEADTIVWAVVARPYVLIQENRHVSHS